MSGETWPRDEGSVERLREWLRVSDSPIPNGRARALLADRDAWRTLAQTASDAVKAAHAERDDWKARALAAEGREEMLRGSSDDLAASYVAMRAERDALRARLDDAELVVRKVADVHAAYCTAEERSLEETAALNAFDDVCCNEVSAFLAPGAAGEPAKEGTATTATTCECTAEPRCLKAASPGERMCDWCTERKHEFRPAPATPTKGTR